MLAIIDYDAGNLKSVQRACAEVGVNGVVTNDSTVIRDADRVIFPGVGAAGAAMRSVRQSGVADALKDCFLQAKPILGICMGMQISLERSEEDSQETLGFIDGEVKRFRVSDPNLKVPHMGWNELSIVQKHPLLHGVREGDEFYFVHAYYPVPKLAADIYALATYENPFCCALGKNSFFGTQFHPEKSGLVGLRFLENFTTWDGGSAQ